MGRCGQLVTKEELLNAVWPGTFVGEAVLKVAIRQLREVLGDDPKSPRFIETAHRRGYRFIGHIAKNEPAPLNEGAGNHARLVVSERTEDFSQPVIGRDGPLSRMQSWLEKMLGGERQIVFVTGEAGIGKTALVDMFLRRIASDRSIRVGRGQCLEQYGTSEAYLPVLEAIGRLGREQRQVVVVLRAHAPMWLLQMPSLLSAPDRKLLSREVFGATRERMLREMGEALAELTAEMPLVLVLEDLHWSDYSTVDLISYLANQRQAARLMLIGTYRPVDVIVSGHPLKAVKRELLAKQQCEELPLEYLSKEGRELCQQLGETQEISRVLWGLWTFRILRAELGAAREIAEEFLRLSERLSHPGLAMRAHLVMEVTTLHLGEFASAIEHFEKALSLYDPEQHRDDAFLYTQNPGAAMRCFAAWALWFLGRPDQAVDRMQEALTLARELCEPHGLAHASCLRQFFISFAVKHGWRRITRRLSSPFPANTGW